MEYFLADIKGSGADDHQVIQQKQKVKGNDSDICINQECHQRGENRRGQVLDRDTGQSGEH